MTEQPIIFTAESIRAILDGTKTQTRRLRGLKAINSDPNRWRLWGPAIDGNWALTDHPHQGEKGTVVNVRCPFGVIGDHLWAREKRWPTMHYAPCPVRYATEIERPPMGFRWKSPIYMPRWASRLTVEITGVRLERLFDISEGAAMCEGVDIDTTGTLTYRGAFAVTWEAINGKRGYGWESGLNPWVWAITFRRVQS